MELGKEVGDDILQARIDGLRPNKCCTLIYTVTMMSIENDMSQYVQ